MAGFLEKLSHEGARAFAAEGLPGEWGTVKRSDRPDLGEFQISGALGAAKAAGSSPRAVAEKIAARLRASGQFAKVEIAGPGFINLTPERKLLEAALAETAGDARLGVATPSQPDDVVIDFGGPNVAKPMHVGHLRSTIIGDSLQRLFRFAGDRVTSDIHMGDWGLQMGQLISEIAREKPGLPYFDPKFQGPYPAESPVTMDELEVIYPRAAAACKEDKARAEEARRATAELQAGRRGYRALWQHFVKVTEAGLKREFGALGIRFDEWKGESHAEPFLAGMIEDLKKRRIAEESEGALIVKVAEAGDKKEIPPLILVKSDGAVPYGTTDLATIVDRVKAHDPTLILYVVDQRQHDHFEQVFRAARIAGFAGRARLEHIGFGTVNGPDGRPFKTREGGVMKLYDLIEMATEEAQKRLAEQGLSNEYGAEERSDIARKVGIAAIKFADLSNHRLTNYIFDLERFTRFEGKTGPYLQYAAVRIKSLLRKAGEQGFRPGAIMAPAPAERALAIELLTFPEAVQGAKEKRAPNFLCDYAYTLAQSFSRFYTEHHILSETDAALRASRLGLCELTLKSLTLALGLLGIETPERM